MAAEASPMPHGGPIVFAMGAQVCRPAAGLIPDRAAHIGAPDDKSRTRMSDGV